MKSWYFIVFILLTFVPVSRMQPYLCNSEGYTYPGEAAVVADMQSLPADYEQRWTSKSPNCRYIVKVYRTAENPDDRRLYLMWDLQTGQRILEFPYFYFYSGGSFSGGSFYGGLSIVPNIKWKPDETEVIIGGWLDSVYPGDDDSIGPYFLFKLNTGESYELTCIDTCAHGLYQNLLWDDRHNWLWVSGKLGITVYDRRNGIEVATLRNPPWESIYAQYYGHQWQFSHDGSHVIVYITENGGYNNSLTVYDLATWTPIAINVDAFVPSSTCGQYTAFDLSPDNGYLAVGFTAIRVWDLHNLQEKYEDRQPLYRHAGPDGYIHCLHFVSDTVIETESRDGVQQWDLHTGALIPIENDTP